MASSPARTTVSTRVHHAHEQSTLSSAAACSRGTRSHSSTAGHWRDLGPFENNVEFASPAGINGPFRYADSRQIFFPCHTDRCGQKGRRPLFDCVQKGRWSELLPRHSGHDKDMIVHVGTRRVYVHRITRRCHESAVPRMCKGIQQLVPAMAGPNIKWTAGPGPAPLPYSKRAREALGVTDDVRIVKMTAGAGGREAFICRTLFRQRRCRRFAAVGRECSSHLQYY